MGSIGFSATAEGAAKPCARFRSGFPKQGDRSLSYWLETAQGDPLLHYQSSVDLPAKADIAIIGSGITGTLIAKTCAETWPGKSIVLFEAREFCSGATGRNAGHCKPDQWRGFDEYKELFGTQSALKILESEQRTWMSLVQYVRENNVECDLWVGETLDVAIDADASELANNTFGRFKAAGGRVDHVTIISDPAQAVEVSRIRDARACYAWPASTLNPWKLTAHIMRENLGKGVNLQTHTAVARVVRSPHDAEKWLVKTHRRDVECSQVIHATNAYSSALEPSLQGLITPTPHICSKFLPLATSPEFGELGKSYGILLPGNSLITVNARRDIGGPILLGGNNPGQDSFEEWMEDHPHLCTDDSLTSFPSVTEAARKYAEDQFLGWNAGSTDLDELYHHSWSGIIGRSADTVPFVGELPGLHGQWVCAGYHGHGMAHAFTVAPAMVKLMAGRPWADTGLPDVFQMTQHRMNKLLNRTTGEARTIRI